MASSAEEPSASFQQLPAGRVRCAGRSTRLRPGDAGPRLKVLPTSFRQVALSWVPV